MEALIIGCWHWTEPQLGNILVRELNVPICLYTKNDPRWAGACNIASMGASLWEIASSSHALYHERIRENKEELLNWINGTTTLQKLRKSSVLLWGGSYSLRMEHLRDDSAKLKSFLVGDVLEEGEYFLIKRAERILKEQPKRINSFISWLKDNGTKVVLDTKMLTSQILRKESALYLAARDRLNELGQLNIRGVSIKCQNCLSMEYGVTPCFLPAFLPFATDSEGEQSIVPTVCEGDIKGIITSVLLSLIRPDIPPLFGDLMYVGNEYFILSNCGASSIYYAHNSLDYRCVLPKIVIKGQCKGKAGGAVSYMGYPGRITLARLVRIKGKYLMQLGLGGSFADNQGDD